MPLFWIIQKPLRGSMLTVTGSDDIPSAGGAFRYFLAGVFCPPSTETHKVPPRLYRRHRPAGGRPHQAAGAIGPDLVQPGPQRRRARVARPAPATPRACPLVRCHGRHSQGTSLHVSHPSIGPMPVLVFSTAGLPAARRVERWESHNAAALIGLDVRADGPLEATEVNVQLPEVRLARVRGSAHAVERTARVIGRCPADSVAIYLTLRGDASFTSADGSTRTPPGRRPGLRDRPAVRARVRARP